MITSAASFPLRMAPPSSSSPTASPSMSSSKALAICHRVPGIAAKQAASKLYPTNATLAPQISTIDLLDSKSAAAAETFDNGKIIGADKIFRQCMLIRSYEAQASGMVSLETLMNYFQETSINHQKCDGLSVHGFGSTREMFRRNLMWVAAKMHVEAQSYPSWGSALEIHTWWTILRRNSIRRNWHVKHLQTGQTVAKASCILLLMNKNTRKFSKIPDAVNEEMEPYCSDHPAILSVERRTVPLIDDETADCIKTGLTPRWSDLDVNMHANNVKYIGWFLESTPVSIQKSHQISTMMLEFRKECGMNSVLRSLTAVSANSVNGGSDGSIECKHLLQLEGGDVLVKGLTRWRPMDPLHTGGPVPIPGSSV